MCLVYAHRGITALKGHQPAHQTTVFALQAYTVLLEAVFLSLVVMEHTLTLLDSLVAQFVLKASTVFL